MSRRVRGLAIHRSIVYGNSAVRLTPDEGALSGHTHRWTVALRSGTSPPPEGHEEVVQIGGADDMSYFIKRVSFKLHESYPVSLRTIDRPPYEVTETGYGEFDIVIKIHFTAESGEKPLTLYHSLKLHPWGIDTYTGPSNILPLELKPIIASLPPAHAPDPSKPAEGATLPDGSAAPQSAAEPPSALPTLTPEPPLLPPPAVIVPSPVYSFQYDEIVFVDPPEGFYNLMCRNPPTPLPESNRRLLTAGTPVHPIGPSGNVGELSQDIESFEARRLDRARLTTLAEIDKWRTRLLELERLRTATVDAAAPTV